MRPSTKFSAGPGAVPLEVGGSYCVAGRQVDVESVPRVDDAALRDDERDNDVGSAGSGGGESGSSKDTTKRAESWFL